MSIKFEKLTAASMDEIKHFSSMRDIYTSEGQFMNQFIWAEFYDTYYHSNDKYLFYKMKISNEYATMMPMCSQNEIIAAFWEIKAYFNDELKLPLKMYIVDENVIETLKTSTAFLNQFEFAENRDCFDYIYDADKLRTLSGKKYHKKKNHLNSFIKNFKDRFEYRTLCCSDIDEIRIFHQKWLNTRDFEDPKNSITSEENGIHRIFENCSQLDCRIGGVYVDGKLESYSIGSYNSNLKCAFIHIEKANIEIPGLYNYINQQFLLNEFPEALLVNREDDLGQEGLRKSKMSYRPVRLEKKFNIIQKH